MTAAIVIEPYSEDEVIDPDTFLINQLDLNQVIALTAFKNKTTFKLMVCPRPTSLEG